VTGVKFFKCGVHEFKRHLGHSRSITYNVIVSSFGELQILNN